ncbi:hypothetical protein [Polyangium aurulentum]|uniref:hypothetical protein n=1 Tax=Polyangium aurulentum TaxID=2567896 RepID=UPI0010ADD000|nr:hypothetical protein [Polyangium aurulentum]UQA56612.1 hypothetical protein E8A73_035685 [Polyangium aurulentum]
MQLLPAGGAVKAARCALALLIVLGLGSSSCGATRAIGASASDWSAYRATRVSSSLEGRLAAAARYLERYPQGTFASDVRAWFSEAEPVYFDVKRQSAAGLHAYLATLSRGPHAADARDTLRRFEARAPLDGDGLDATALRADARIAAAAATRAEAHREIMAYTFAFLDPGAFTRPLTEAKADLVTRWSLRLPPPVCGIDDAAPNGGARRCAKILELPYLVSTGEGTDERQATVEITLVQDARGRPREVTIGGPDLFVRLEEIMSGRAITTGDGAGRAAGVSRAVEIVRRAFASRVSDAAGCKKRVQPPDVLALECGGVRAVVRAALDTTDDDRIILGPPRSAE